MRILIRVLSAVLLLVAFYWIYRQPSEVEPYAASLGALVGLLATFIEHGKRDEPRSSGAAKLWLRAVGLEELEPDKLPKVRFEYENVGDADAEQLQIETGVFVGSTRLEGGPPPMKFETMPSLTCLPKGKTMTKTIPFRRAISQSEYEQICSGALFVYAYSILCFRSSATAVGSVDRVLRTCNLYNPATTYFQATPFHNSAT